MKTAIYDSTAEMSRQAALTAARTIEAALQQRGHANLVVATGNSQLDMLRNLSQQTGIDWSRITLFHLDEYVGIDEEHPASFRRYLRTNFLTRIPQPKAFYWIDGDAGSIEAEMRRLNDSIGSHRIDLALVGIGENGHLAFNDPPADFEVEQPYIVVELDERCKRQQVGEGWFPTIADVPDRAISMSIKQIMKSAAIIVTVPDARKREAVERVLHGDIGPHCPASILRRHGDCYLFLDRHSAGQRVDPL